MLLCFKTSPAIHNYTIFLLSNRLSSMSPFIFYLASYHLLFLFTIAGKSSAYKPIDYILLSCGASSAIRSEDGREWVTDERSKFFTSNPEKVSFVSAASRQDQSVSQVPYMTARAFQDKFTYSFPVLPGLKFLRFYFYPVQYSGFDGTTSFFSVTANNYVLLKNFSAYLTVSAIIPPRASLIKEFMVPVLDKERLNVTFSPSPNSVAFVNGIEVVSIPDNLYGGDREKSLPFVNKKFILFDIPITTAFETAYRLNVGGQDVANVEDTGMFRTWHDDSSFIFGGASGVTPHRSNVTITYTQETPAYTAPAIVYSTSRTMGPNPEINMNYNLTWIFSVDTGFNYLLRLHFCEIDLQVMKVGQRVFDIYINNQTADLSVDMIDQSGGNSKPMYKDYVVLIPNGSGQSEQDLWLALHPSKDVGSKFADAILNGLEIFRLNKSDGGLAVPNPDPLLSLTPPKPEQKKLKLSSPNRAIIGGALGGGAAVLLCLLFSFIFWRQKRLCSIKRKSMERRKTSSLPDKLCLCFTLAEIQAATSNFDDSYVIGRGGFGKVYKGFIKGIKRAVAIKRLNSQSQQGAREFWTEIQMLSQLRHIHLVSLIGYCNDDNEMILVYDYMANGTLRDHLYNKDKSPLSWKQRLKICIGAAYGLDYLHSGAIYRIIHRDVKSTNILLDENYVAKVSDFGLSKMSPISMTNVPVTTMVKGTFGYMDPEYYRRQQLTEKSDVYSFGVVLFEVLCARPAVDSKLEYSQISLANWGRKCVENDRIGQIIDPFLKDQISPACLRAYAKVAENCVRQNGLERPTMNDVAQRLEFALQLQEIEEAEQTCQAGDGDQSQVNQDI
ncbi:receptor-like protein kinase FERONIA [Durio zibethinus]|uniref:Receptor-like protein kinase FERONIA n=1 Tax=Durio zibethinus TaxID=66656 RepID=A0A6P6A9C9_DURZI|nr:receptor-like protein kinase FERONIA [Durio zibethinus]